MRFPLAWSVPKVLFYSVLWLIAGYGIVLALSVTNIGPVGAQQAPVQGFSIFMLSWPRWLDWALWAPPILALLWRVLFPPIPTAGSRAV